MSMSKMGKPNDLKVFQRARKTQGHKQDSQLVLIIIA
jgi:hypothetical protein